MHPVALFGAAGYTGVELIKLLSGHPDVRLACAASDGHAGRRVEDLTGRASDLVFVSTEQARAIAADCEVALLAVPPDAAAALAPSLAARVIDLSHAHRATAGAVYGLASLFGGEVAGARLVANPGCYATSVITAAAPLVRHGLVDGDVVVSAGSGVTGAGRSSDEALSLGEMYGEVRAYKVLRHQHVPEIEAALARVGMTAATRVVLTTHLLPVARGIFATLTVRLARRAPTAELVELYRRDYAGDPTVRIARTAEEVSLRRIVGTNLCAVGVASDERHVIVTVAIDNLLKGAAGQAVENLNVMLGLPRTAGLEHLARHA
ncbi:MAG: N-acetyl-gamma-glutamyl-phosphate reductase [Deltaproteobacteria bacterium]|nr:N-acetyl-gamma-glutamyl-phosphate reductase [Deltaproteobacteria bacterium]